MNEKKEEREREIEIERERERERERRRRKSNRTLGKKIPGSYFSKSLKKRKKKFFSNIQIEQES